MHEPEQKFLLRMGSYSCRSPKLRRLPLRLVVLALPILFLTLKTPVRDALEVSVQASATRVRNLLGKGALSPGNPPCIRADVKAFLHRELAVSCGGNGRRIVQLRAEEDRFHLVVEGGSRAGVQLGDLAVFKKIRDGPDILAGVVDGLSDSFARICTLEDHETWLRARTSRSRMVLVKGKEPGELCVEVPENPQSLEEEDVVTEKDVRSCWKVPEGLIIGRLKNRATRMSPDWWVESFFNPRRVLGVRFLRGGKALDGIGPGDCSPAPGKWMPVQVNRVRDSNPVRASAIITREDHSFPFPVDAPVARGAYLEGWVHTAAGRDARVRLVEDPGFYVHVLVLRKGKKGLVSPGGGVFRGDRRTGNGLRGVVGTSRVDIRENDLLVVGPHKGGGGIGLLIGEVVHCGVDGAVVLRRPSTPERGDSLHVGLFPRPPRLFQSNQTGQKGAP